MKKHSEQFREILKQKLEAIYETKYFIAKDFVGHINRF